MNRWFAVSIAVFVTVSMAFAQSPEIGDNDFQISFLDGNINEDPALAYNATEQEFLVVWSGAFLDDEFCPLELEIFARRVDAATGVLLGNQRRISKAGQNDCDATYEAHRPDVAWNATENEYLVVWDGDSDAQGLGSDDEFEIFGRFVDVDGSPMGSDFRISNMGGLMNPDYDGQSPAVVWNAAENEYFVVWHGNDNEGGLDPNEIEIFAQRLAENGTAQGLNDFRVSSAGGIGNDYLFALYPDVAWNANQNEYLVVWQGEHNEGGLEPHELEIWGQRIHGDLTQGALISSMMRISDMGGTGDSDYDAQRPAITWNDSRDEYLVVWQGDDNVGGLSEGEDEIFGQRLDAAGLPLGSNDFRISDMGGTGQNPFSASRAAVSWSPTVDEYLVVWDGDDDVGGLIDGEIEIFGQYLDGLGGEIGINDFRISDMGGIGIFGFRGDTAAVASRGGVNQALVVWSGEDIFDSYEIHGQRLQGNTIFGDGFESGDTAAWTVTVP